MVCVGADSWGGGNPTTSSLIGLPHCRSLNSAPCRRIQSPASLLIAAALGEKLKCPTPSTAWLNCTSSLYFKKLVVCVCGGGVIVLEERGAPLPSTRGDGCGGGNAHHPLFSLEYLVAHHVLLLRCVGESPGAQIFWRKAQHLL